MKNLLCLVALMSVLVGCEMDTSLISLKGDTSDTRLYELISTDNNDGNEIRMEFRVVPEQKQSYNRVVHEYDIDGNIIGTTEIAIDYTVSGNYSIVVFVDDAIRYYAVSDTNQYDAIEEKYNNNMLIELTQTE